MIQPKSINYKFLTLLVLVLLGFLFRYINLDWGAPYFFHPDERNIASSISQLSYKKDLNPKFFAYGSLPIYSIYFTGVTLNLIEYSTDNSVEIDRVTFEDAILIGRTLSFIASILLVYVVYKTALLLNTKQGSTISAFLALFSIGFIQYAHYATFEMWLSLLTIILCYLSILYSKNKDIKYFLLSSFIIGLMISVKVSSLVFAPIVLLVFLFYELKKLIRSKRKIILIRDAAYAVVFFSAIATITVFFTSPYYWLDNASFQSSISYESSVALGTIDVFYTQFFRNTIPILYQLTNVYPFILNPIIFSIACLSLFYVLFRGLKERKSLYLILILFFAGAFLSQAFLYVKWVRYYIPTLPFVYIFIGIFISGLRRSRHNNKKLTVMIASLLVLVSLIYSFSFVKTVYINKDSRVEAAQWAEKNIASDSAILSEIYDMGIVPFNNNYKEIKLFNFYDLEKNQELKDELKITIKDYDYIILPSQRILSSRISMPNTFPEGYLFYRPLLNENGFEKVYETQCDIFCKLVYLNDPINAYEQTANVFDRPQFVIYKIID